jgi:hypothetical protein
MNSTVFKVRMVEIIIKQYCIFKVIFVCSFPYPVKGGKLAEKEVEGLGVCHVLMMWSIVNGNRQEAPGDRSVSLKSVSIYFCRYDDACLFRCKLLILNH